ncbi:hypothetical protein [Silvanigrella aquatica]|uniref:Uncharacterized protein n=1 Tax=Silvanigrella aquatica TaxID=1915309 RepID=A0A1L4D0A9_9BACT|nr:hypothetical protein [Silvanigrella aquatica]APJ03635.1 hypothetical protein AXG55_06830 [Silvanigrella aquatica]
MFKKIIYPFIIVSVSSASAQEVNFFDETNFLHEIRKVIFNTKSCQNELQHKMVGPSGTLQSVINNLGNSYSPANLKYGIVVDSLLVTALTAGLATYTAGIDGMNITSILDLIKQIQDHDLDPFSNITNGNGEPHCKIDPQNVYIASKLIRTSINSIFFANNLLGHNDNGVNLEPKTLTIKETHENDPELHKIRLVNRSSNDITIEEINGIQIPLQTVMKKDSCQIGSVIARENDCHIYLKIDTSNVHFKKQVSMNIRYKDNDKVNSISNNIIYGVASKDCVPFKVYAPAGIGYAIEIKKIDYSSTNLGSCSIFNDSNYGGDIKNPNYFKLISVWNETPNIYVLKNSSITLNRYLGSQNNFTFNIGDGENNYVQCTGTTFLPSQMPCTISHKELESEIKLKNEKVTENNVPTDIIAETDSLLENNADTIATLTSEEITLPILSENIILPEFDEDPSEKVDNLSQQNSKIAFCKSYYKSHVRNAMSKSLYEIYSKNINDSNIERSSSLSKHIIFSAKSFIEAIDNEECQNDPTKTVQNGYKIAIQKALSLNVPLK